MKKLLVICMLLICMTCFASGPALKDCAAASATVTQTIDPVTIMPALTPEAVVLYELPFAGTIPELGTPIVAAELKGYGSDIWHPPVLNSSVWLNSNYFELLAMKDPINKMDLRWQSTSNPGKRNKQFYRAWYDID